MRGHIASAEPVYRAGEKNVEDSGRKKQSGPKTGGTSDFNGGRADRQALFVAPINKPANPEKNVFLSPELE